MSDVQQIKPIRSHGNARRYAVLDAGIAYGLACATGLLIWYASARGSHVDAVIYVLPGMTAMGAIDAFQSFLSSSDRRPPRKTRRRATAE